MSVPLPAVPEVDSTESHAAFAAAFQAQLVGAVTETEPVDVPAATLTLVGDSAKEQLPAMARKLARVYAF